MCTYYAVRGAYRRSRHHHRHRETAFGISGRRIVHVSHQTSSCARIETLIPSPIAATLQTYWVLILSSRRTSLSPPTSIFQCMLYILFETPTWTWTSPPPRPPATVAACTCLTQFSIDTRLALSALARFSHSVGLTWGLGTITQVGGIGVGVVTLGVLGLGLRIWRWMERPRSWLTVRLGAGGGVVFRLTAPSPSDVLFCWVRWVRGETWFSAWTTCR